MKALLFTLTTCIALLSCSASSVNETLDKNPPKDLKNLQTAYFSSGCFWCVEAVFESVKGVEEVVSGYSGGTEKNPSYEQVGAGRTGHAETVKVYYDSTIVSYETLVAVFFNSHDPSTLNRQGPDSGTQYRSIAFYQNQQEKSIIEQKIQSLLANNSFPKITTQVVPFDVFYEAEDYHQDYERTHPENGYVQGVSIPRLNAFKQKMPEVLK